MASDRWRDHGWGGRDKAGVPSVEGKLGLIWEEVGEAQDMGSREDSGSSSKKSRKDNSILDGLDDGVGGAIGLWSC